MIPVLIGGLAIASLTFNAIAAGSAAGAGYGTDGSSFFVGISENNFNGKGIKLSTNVEIGTESVRGSIFYTNPNFAYSDRALTTSLQSTVTDKLTDSGYKSTINAISLGTRYEQFDDLFFSPSFSISDESSQIMHPW